MIKHDIKIPYHKFSDKFNDEQTETVNKFIKLISFMTPKSELLHLKERIMAHFEAGIKYEINNWIAFPQYHYPNEDDSEPNK